MKLWVRDLEEFFFCPMVFYFSVVLGIGRNDGYWAELGKSIQEDSERIITEEFEIYAKELKLESEKLGVIGKVDFVVKEGDSIAPLEIKYSSKLKPWWKYSAVLYAMLLEEKIGEPVKRSYVYLTESGKFIKIDIGDEERRYVLKSIRSCREILNGKQPKPRVSKSCENCDYKWICLER